MKTFFKTHYPKVLIFASVCLLLSLFFCPETLGLNLAWQKTYGTEYSERLSSLIQTSDGGFALAGVTVKEFEPGEGDCLLIKTNAKGEIIFSQTYGEEGFHDDASSVIQTSDGGFAMAGYSGYIGSDFLLVRTDADGNLMWRKTYDFASSDYATDVVQTSDGGFAILGSVYPDDADCWLGKTDAEGNLLWNRTYEGGANEEGMSLVGTLDGGFAFAAIRIVDIHKGETWLVKTDHSGNLMWEQTFTEGTSGNHRALIQTRDGEYALTGTTRLSGSGDGDFWLVKTDSAGNMLWNKGFERESQDQATSLIETSDGGFAVLGNTFSYPGDSGGYLITTDADGNMLWDQTFSGGVGPVWLVVETSDGAFAIASTSEEDSGDFWLLKTETVPSANSTGQTTIDIADLAPYIIAIIILIVITAFIILRKKQSASGILCKWRYLPQNSPFFE